MNLLPVPLVAMEEYYSKFTIFHWSHNFTKDANMIVIGRYLRAAI